MSNKLKFDADEYGIVHVRKGSSSNYWGVGKDQDGNWRVHLTVKTTEGRLPFTFTSNTILSEKQAASVAAMFFPYREKSLDLPQFFYLTTGDGSIVSVCLGEKKIRVPFSTIHRGSLNKFANYIYKLSLGEKFIGNYYSSFVKVIDKPSVVQKPVVETERRKPNKFVASNLVIQEYKDGNVSDEELKFLKQFIETVLL